MKIVIITSFAPEILNFRGDMIKSFKKKGHNVVIYGPEQVEEMVRLKTELEIDYQTITLSRTGKSPLTDAFTVISILIRLLKDKPDIVFSYSIKPVIYGSIAAKLAHIPHIYSMMSGLGSVIRSEDRKSGLLKKIVLFQLKIAFAGCDSVIFHNKQDAEEFLSMGLVKGRQVAVINGSGVNLEKFDYRRIKNNNIFLFIGRIIKDKGIMEYMEAAKMVKQKYPNSRFQVLGPFDSNPTAIQKDEFDKWVSQGIIEYLGTTEDVRPFLEECTVFVLPSYHEGTPKSVLEAMAIGRTIITTDAPGCKETVLEGENGFLVPVKDYVKLAERMIWTIEHNELIDKMSYKSRMICKEKYDVHKVNVMIHKIINI